MVWYFYKAEYDPTEYKTPEPVLHAQVATIAGKFVCPSLYNLAKTSFAKTTKTIESEDWVAVAAFLYEQTSTEVPAHNELRNLVITALTGHLSVLQSTLQNHSIVELLRSNEDLATDLLIAMRTKKVSQHIFICDNCQYAHSGAPDCANIATTDSWGHITCPSCGNGSRTVSKRYAHKVSSLSAFPCSSCDGFHTEAPKLGPKR